MHETENREASRGDGAARLSVGVGAMTLSAREGTASVQSVLMAVRVLEAMALAGGPVRLADLARLLEQPKGRVHRHLVTLREAGLVAQEDATERYHLTWRMFRIGQAAGEHFDLKRVADPIMRRLRDAAGQSVVLAVPAAGAPLVVHALDAPNAVLISARPGHRPAIHCSAQGRVMLAFARAGEVARVLAGPLPAATPASLVDVAALRARLDLVRQRLWDTAASETVLGVNALAAPIFAADGALVGTISLVGSVQFLPEPPLPGLIAAVLSAAADISAQLGATREGAQPVVPLD